MGGVGVKDADTIAKGRIWDLTDMPLRTHCTHAWNNVMGNFARARCKFYSKPCV